MGIKREYKAPQVQALGSVEEVTGWVGGGAGEFFGGNQASRGGKKLGSKGSGPADFGS